MASNDITDVPGISTPGSTRRVFVWSAIIAGILTAITVYFGVILVGKAYIEREVVDRAAFVPIEGPGYVGRKLGYKSVLDQSCLKLWNNPLNGFNTSLNGVRGSMLCYSKSQPERLCDPKEKEYFIRLIGEYVAYEGMAPKPLTPPTFDIQMDANSGTLNTIEQIEPVDPLDTVAAWRELAASGLIERSDFPWLAHQFVEAAFIDVTALPNPCQRGS